ncbi:MAG: cyclopropane-fatty-acyl-phospholipid synthase family protein [Chloroflexi bacterium]|nr:cyclopropane-fatty-acyl-phospholipid synthase family protein [Chloroflexota bacterium]
MSEREKVIQLSLQARQLLESLLSLLPERPFAIYLPDGTTIDPEPNTAGPPPFRLILKRPAALRRMFLPPSELAMGEGYIFDDFDIEGDIVAAFRFIDRLEWRRPSLPGLLRLAGQLLRLERAGPGRATTRPAPSNGFATFAPAGRRHEPERDRQAVRFHYDLSNAFFKLWLDERMVYSCAYFEDAGEVLETAQWRKLDRACRKLNLEPGERLLDIGCGWGGLLIYAATEYGVQATGISLSEAQTAEAGARIQAQGLAGRCQVHICHYEQFQADQPFDKIVSVGMLSHVGPDKLASYFSKAHHLLRPGGLFLVQEGAARVDRRHVGRRWMERLGQGRNAFLHKYSFPDSYLPDIATVLAMAERAGFETRDVESLREHYPLTLQQWLRRLERNQVAATAEVGQAAYRCWRLVLAGYLYLLEQGKLAEYQSLLARPSASGCSELPLARPL